jgi:hypothetical protein
MRKFLILLVVGLVGIAFYAVFLHIPVCLNAAVHRNSLLSQLKICPPFVSTTLEEVRAQFEKKVKPGDEKQNVEKALAQIGIAYSWDGFSERYQGIIRHPNSNFHAIVIHVYVDGEAKYERIEIEDSFTAL